MFRAVDRHRAGDGGERRAHGRYRALTSQDIPNPGTACLGTGELACVKINRGILIGTFYAADNKKH